MQLHRGEHDAPQFKESNAKAVLFPIGITIHEALGMKRGQDAVGGAQGQPSAAANLAQRQAWLLKGEGREDADRLA